MTSRLGSWALRLAHPCIVLVALAMCGNSAQAQSSEIVIGAHIPLTGPNADSATRLEKAYQLLIDNTNAAGGIKGRKLRLSVEDDRNDPTTVRSAIDRLATRDKVVGILGTYGSANGIAGAQQSERYSIPNIQPFTSNPAIVTSGYKYVFNLTAGDDERWGRLLDYLLTLKAGQKVAAISIEGIAPTSFQALDERAKKHSIDVVAREVIGARQVDMNSLATLIKSKQPDIVIYNATIPQSIQIHRSLKQQGANIPWIARSPSFGLDNEIVEALGNDLDYVVGLDEWYPGAKTPGNAEFVAQFTKRFGYEPTRIESKGYASGQILVKALEQAKEITPQAVRDIILKGNTETILGPVSFKENGQRHPENMVGQIQKGKLVILSPDHLKTGSPVPAPAWSSR